MKNMMKAAVFIGLCIVISGCATVKNDRLAVERLFPAPTIMPNTVRDMKTAGFWIEKSAFPDDEILSAPEIKSLNYYIESKLRTTRDILKCPVKSSGAHYRKYISGIAENLEKKRLYDINDMKVGKDFYARVHGNIGFDKMPKDINTEYGLIAKFSDQRLLPTDERLFAKKGDIDFDELQNSGLDIGTPVSIYHTTLDSKWCFVSSPISDGWVKRENIALCKKGELKDFLRSKNFIVVISPKAEIFLNNSMTDYFDYVRMGVRLPIKNKNKKFIEIILPSADSSGRLKTIPAYIEKEDVNLGYLKYTKRNILNQAFKMLNQPYGWGCYQGEQDCSRFINEVFSTVGINLPRNSSAQGKCGKKAGEFSGKTTRDEKLKVLKENAVPAAAILQFNGHIGLYLGLYQDNPYIIHDTWGYRERQQGSDVVRVANRVVVTDLSLGEGSAKTSLLNRIKAVRNLSK